MRKKLITRIKEKLIKDTSLGARIRTYSDKMGFGKHRDNTVEELLESDPSYLVWAHDNIEWFKLEKNIYNLAKKYNEINYRNRYYRDYESDNDSWYGAVDPYDFCD